MKLAFSTKSLKAACFTDICNTASDYGFSGFEIYDIDSADVCGGDGPFGVVSAAGAKRKLVNRHIAVSALRFPFAIGESEATAEAVLRYIDKANFLNVNNVIVTVADGVSAAEVVKILEPVMPETERSGVTVLFETAGELAKTQRVIDIINGFSCGFVGASWNIRETYFKANEDAEKTIQILGAYIGNVSIGDCKNGKNVLLGEGELPVNEFALALRSLNYDGFITVLDNDEITDTDIVFTHFVNFMNSVDDATDDNKALQYNRDRSGRFVWKRYDVIDKTFSEVLDTMVEHFPDQYAFKYTTLDYTRTYAEFRRDVDTVAASLISLGVKPGHHVAIWATNVPQWFLTFWATVKIGAVLVTVNTAYKLHEAEYLLRQSDTHTLVMIDSCKDSNYKEIIETLCPELKTLVPGQPLHCEKLPFLKNIVTVGFEMDGCLTWEEMLSRSATVPVEEVRRRAAEVKPDDVCNMQYTSGTTGFPKGVMLTHRNIVNNGKIIGDRMDLSTADRMMIQVPMFHCFGMVLSMTSMMTHGGTLCPLPYFSPKSSLACVNDEKITCFNGVPTMFIAMFAHADFKKTDFSHIRTGIMAGANCPADLMRRAADEMNMKEIISVYGQTEASPGCTMGEVNEDIDHRVETVGSAFPGVECKIIDPETGEDLPDGENGEFVARGYNIMKGYYKMPKATASTIDKEGWLHSGDIACRTPDGYYKITGRLKDMIIRGGENLYPREIEEFYLGHDKVKDVQVVGVPDKRYGEEACAWIILNKGETSSEEEMREYGNSFMARHKVPRYFIFTKEFPMNAAGKILKYKMRDESVEILKIEK
ncbi:MAG: AMP-dependent synthetase [Ruminococcaceae bacterium]|nr:AMP-dependent synthetase [Oscillospiraceae bacterium]